MTTPWRKAMRDFWQERTRTIFVAAAIALGISGFAAVLSSYSILTRTLDEGYLATNPASFTVRADAVDDDLLRAVRSHPAVGEAEARRTVSGRLKTGPVEWRGLTLFVVPDFRNIRVSRIEPQRGAWPPAPGEILIERDALQVAKARIGDAVTIRTARGNEQTLRVAGTAKDVGQAQARMENIVYAYTTPETLSLLGEEAHLNELKVVAAENKFDEAHVRQVAGEVAKLVESRGRAVSGVQVPAPGKHPHTDIMGLLLLSMAAFGLFVLLLSGVIVVNLLTALMASQVRQIGVMKTVGGSRWQIAQIYFAQAALLGVAAIIISVPAGVLGARALCRYMAVLLNFDIESYSVPAWVYLSVALVGVVVPLLAAAYPVWKGSGVSVREALSDFGVSRNVFGAGAFDRALAGMGGVARPLLLAVRNSFRRRARLALTLLTLAAGGLFYMTALNVRASLINSLDRLFATRKFDLTVTFPTAYPFERIERAALATPGVRAVEGWLAAEGSIPAPDAPDGAASGAATPAANAVGGHGGGSGDGGGHAGGAREGLRFTAIGLPPETRMHEPDIVEGRALQPGDTEAVIVNTVLAARAPQLKVGGIVTLRIGAGQSAWRVVGIAREPFSPATAYVPRAYFDKQHPGQTNSVRLALDRADRDWVNRVKADLDRNLEQEGVRSQTSASKSDGRYGFDQHMLMIYVFLIIVSCVLGLVGGLGLLTTMSINVLERRREMGVLRAVGATPAAVCLIVIAEGVFVGLLSWALAVVFAWPVGKALGNFLVKVMFRSDLDFLFEPRALFLWLAVSVLWGAAASFLPAWHASRRPVREAVGYE